MTQQKSSLLKSKERDMPTAVSSESARLQMPQPSNEDFKDNGHELLLLKQQLEKQLEMRAHVNPEFSFFPVCSPSRALAKVVQPAQTSKRASLLTSNSASQRLESSVVLKKSHSLNEMHDEEEDKDDDGFRPSLASDNRPRAGHRRGQSPEHTFAFNTDRYWRSYSFQKYTKSRNRHTRGPGDSPSA